MGVGLIALLGNHDATGPLRQRGDQGAAEIPALESPDRLLDVGTEVVREVAAALADQRQRDHRMGGSPPPRVADLRQQGKAETR
jgi:hypothetical protein